jgi:hypothetical protein
VRRQRDECHSSRGRQCGSHNPGLVVGAENGGSKVKNRLATVSFGLASKVSVASGSNWSDSRVEN